MTEKTQTYPQADDENKTQTYQQSDDNKTQTYQSDATRTYSGTTQTYREEEQRTFGTLHNPQCR